MVIGNSVSTSPVTSDTDPKDEDEGVNLSDMDEETKTPRQNFKTAITRYFLRSEVIASQHRQHQCLPAASTLQSPSEALYLAFETRFSGVELFAGPAFTVIMTSFVMANTFC